MKCAGTVQEAPFCAPAAVWTRSPNSLRAALCATIVRTLIVVFAVGTSSDVWQRHFPGRRPAPTRPPRLISAVVAGDGGRPVNLPRPNRAAFCPVLAFSPRAALGLLPGALGLLSGVERQITARRARLTRPLSRRTWPPGPVAGLKSPVSLFAACVSSPVAS